MSAIERIAELELRVADLERELVLRDDRIKELRAERDEANELVGDIREHLEDRRQLMEAWIDAFRMRETGDGRLEWNSAATELLDQHNVLIAGYNKLVRSFNRLLRERG